MDILMQMVWRAHGYCSGEHRFETYIPEGRKYCFDCGFSPETSVGGEK